MSLKRHLRKALKIVAIFLGCLLILLTAFHFWFVHHAEDIIEDLVASKSNGKLRLEVKKFRFNWLSKKMELVDAVFYSTDSATAGTSYRFAVKEIKLRVKGVLPILFEKKVLINMLDLQEPDIEVTRLRSIKKDSLKTDKEDVSIPQEMGKIYKSIQDALEVLQVKKFQIENARFKLINKIRPDDVPVTIGHIDFHIDNLRIDTGKFTGNEKIFFSDNIVLKSRDQDILLPDGRHRISYRKFRINIEKKIVEFDSCTIAALKTGNAATDFSIYFDALVMTNIDFDTLYRAEVIKADSVYCVNPHFKLNVDLGKRTGGTRKAPQLDHIIRQLTGDMSLNFVIVNNASFDINTIRDGVPNSFTSRSNNFEIQGLHVNNDAVRPLRVEKFAMAIRNYENFLRDSMYALQFDSILVNNDKIYLNNFSFQKRLNGKTVNTFKVPRFQLTGLDWDDLLFQQKLTAQEATLYNPTIDYTELPKPKSEKKHRNIFDALASINEVIMLEDMNIVNGNIDVKLNGNIRMQLRNATIAIESRALLGSNQLAGIRRSVNHLDFNTGYFKVGDLTVFLDSIYYTGQDSRLNAGKVTVNNLSKSVDAALRNVTMDEIFINEANGDVSVAGINWQEADIKLLTPPSSSGKNTSFISLTDINGNNTKLVLPLGKGRSGSVFINHLGMIAFLMKPGERPIIGGLDLSAQDLLVKDTASNLSVATLGIVDQKRAFFEDLRYHKKAGTDSIDINIPLLTFVPNIQPAIAGEIFAGDVRLEKPSARIHLTKREPSDVMKGLNLPKGSINKLIIEQPDIHFSRQSDTGISRISWNKGNKNDAITLTGVDMEGSSFAASELSFALSNFVFESNRGKTFNAGGGELLVNLNNISFAKPDLEEATWKATLTSMDGTHFALDSLGKRNGSLWIDRVLLQNLALNSSAISNPRKIVVANQNFRIQKLTGGYTDSASRFNWYNIGYDKGSREFSLDSFHWVPTPSRDSFIAKQKYQTDYIQLKTGAVRVGPFDIDRYLTDSIVSIGTMQVDDVVFDDYRDNRLPFRSGIIKPLVTDAIKKIPFKLSVDTVMLNNVNILYTEVNPKTNQAGAIPFTRMTLRAFPVRNFDLGPTDSLRIQANGYLMDSVWVRLRLRGSYTDTLSGFLLTVRMRPADMRVLNPMLGPLASAKIRSGYLDTLSMRVAGGEYLSYGEMKLFYHDLKLELYKPGTIRRNSFLTFLANSLLIKNKNTRRTSSVFFVRNRERSSINYLIKTVMSGVTPGIGIKSNRKVMRQYKKELRQRNLPPVDYD